MSVRSLGFRNSRRQLPPVRAKRSSCTSRFGRPWQDAAEVEHCPRSEPRLTSDDGNAMAHAGTQMRCLAQGSTKWPAGGGDNANSRSCWERNWKGGERTIEQL